MNIRKGRMISLGHGRFVRSDHIIGFEPIVEGRGAGKRTRVFVSGVDGPLVASRTESMLLKDLIKDSSSERESRLSTLLTAILEKVEGINPTVQSIIHDQGGWDLARVELEIRTALEEPNKGPETPSKQKGLF